jgi:hypothetical protein
MQKISTHNPMRKIFYCNTCKCVGVILNIGVKFGTFIVEPVMVNIIERDFKNFLLKIPLKEAD